GGFVFFALTDVHPHLFAALLEAFGDEDVVDAQAFVLSERSRAIVPPAVLLGAIVEESKCVAQPEIEDSVDGCVFARVKMGLALEQADVEHVASLARNVEVTANDDVLVGARPRVQSRA